jgi:hypothetical protein
MPNWIRSGFNTKKALMGKTNTVEHFLGLEQAGCLKSGLDNHAAQLNRDMQIRMLDKK